MQRMEGIKEWMAFEPKGWDSFACIRDGEESFLVFAGECQAHATPPCDRVLVYAPDFFLTSKRPWYSFERVFSLRPHALLEKLGASTPAPRRWSEPDFASFRGDFESLGEAFKAKRLHKGVPVAFKTSVGEVQPEERLAYLAAIVRNSKGFKQDAYAFWHQVKGVVGLTPERLFHQDPSGDIQLMAVAGTRLHQDRDKAGVLELLEDPKERAEHQWVIESIVASLEGFGALSVGVTEVRELAHLSHLVTPLVLRPLEREVLSEKTFQELIHQLHPTAALGAFPKVEGWNWLRSRAHPRRGWFGGPFGVFGPGVVAPRVLVMIRNLQWDDKGLLLGAGCGVIRESRIEKEWDEILGKMRAVLKTCSNTEGA
jgi:isochorismate synthase EntC